jgi:hypothetical protein
MEVLGIARQPIEEGLVPLEHRLQFNRRKPPMLGYFLLVAPAFQEFTLRGEPIEGLHVLARASGLSLARGLELCSEVETSLLGRPDAWRHHLGTIKHPGQPELPLQPLIVRRRALAMLSHLRSLFVLAQREEAEVVFANGAFYMPLSGIKLGPGEEYYS